MHQFIDRYQHPSFKKYGLQKLAIQAGIHSGGVIAGVVGKSKFQFDIWGDAVNIASRMESNCERGRINISKSTHDLLKDNTNYSFEKRGLFPIKNRGEIEMYYVFKTDVTTNNESV